MKTLSFNYAIIDDKTNQYYLGSTHGDRSKDFGLPSLYNPVFTYTEEGAHKKMERFPMMFEGCSVVKFIA